MRSKWRDLFRSCCVRGVESGCMSVVSGKLKSPARNVVHVCGGGMCLLMVCSVLLIWLGDQCGGR